jgi:hypothetical protein
MPALAALITAAGNYKVLQDVKFDALEELHGHRLRRPERPVGLLIVGRHGA